MMPAAAASTMISCGTPACASSQAVRRAPCSSGRVSSTSARTRLPSRVRRLDYAERRADAARREAAGIAVREHRRVRRDQLRAEAADGVVGLDLLAVDAGGLGLGARGVAVPGGEDAVDGPAQVDGGGPGRDELGGGRGHVGAVAGGERERVRGGDADERRAAHGQPADGVGDVGGGAGVDVLDRGGQARLVEDAQAVAAPGDGFGLGHPCLR